MPEIFSNYLFLLGIFLLSLALASLSLVWLVSRMDKKQADLVRSLIDSEIRPRVDAIANDNEGRSAAPLWEEWQEEWRAFKRYYDSSQAMLVEQQKATALEISAIREDLLTRLPQLVVHELSRDSKRTESKGSTGDGSTQGNRLRLKERFLNRVSEMPGQEMLQIAQHTAEVVQALRGVAGRNDSLEKTFASYLRLAKLNAQALEFFQGSAAQGRAPEEADVERALQALQEKTRSLTREHQVVPFLQLLDESAGLPALEDSRAKLMDLVGLEEIHPAAGQTLPDTRALEVTRTEGSGSRLVIDEVLSSGYKNTKSSEILRKPKVVVRLEGSEADSGLSGRHDGES